MPPQTRSSQRLALSALLLAAQCSWSAGSTTYEGYGTVYTLSSPSDGNCNFMSWPSDAATKYAALNADQWDETMNCGRCAEVSCTDSSCSGQSSEIVYIMDQCPGCSYGDLDLSPDVFESITGQSYTKLSIEWKFVDCPISNNVQYCLKTGSSEFWVAVQPANFVSGVESLKINSQEASVIDSAYYFLIDGSGESVADLSSVSITLTGVNGEVLEETLSLSADECTDGNSQFSSSGDSTQTSSETQSTSTSPAPTTATPTTTPSPITEAPSTAPVTSAPSTEAPTTEAPVTSAAPTSTPTPSTSMQSSNVGSLGRSSNLRSSTSSSGSSIVDQAIDTANQDSDASAGSTTVQVTVTMAPTTEDAPTSTPMQTVRSNVKSSGGSSSTPLMVGMIILVCCAVLVAVGLALYVRRRKKQIDAYKRREEQGTAMSDEDTSPRASDASSAYDVVHSPRVQYTAMNSL